MKFQTATVTQNNSAKTTVSSNFPLGAGNVYQRNGGRFSATNLPLTAYLGFAYRVTYLQSVDISAQLPEWGRTARYDIEARSADRSATKDQMRLMMQALLADRFKLAIRIETRQLPAYRLVLSDSPHTGPQLPPHPAHDTSCSTKPSSKTIGMFPSECGGIGQMSPHTRGDVRFAARNVNIDLIAGFLSGMPEIDRPLLNRTGLTGTFDFNLEWAPAPNSRPANSSGTSPVPTGPTLREALSQQLGLKLEPEDDPTQTYVIDHIEKPSEN